MSMVKYNVLLFFLQKMHIMYLCVFLCVSLYVTMQPHQLKQAFYLCYRYAHYLFENGSYEEAMEHFVASQVEITYVLALYPSIVVPKSSVVPEPDKFLDVGGEAYLSRGSSGISDDMEPSSNPLEYDESSALESKKMSHNTLMALVKFLQKKRSNIIGKAAAEGTDEVVSDAVGHTFVSYESNRPKRSTKVTRNLSSIVH